MQQYVTRKEFAERMHLILPLTYLQCLSYISGFEDVVKQVIMQGKEIRFSFGTFFGLDRTYKPPYERRRITLENYPYFLPPTSKAAHSKLRLRKNEEGTKLFKREEYYKAMQQYFPLPVATLRTITETFELLIHEIIYDQQRMRFKDFYIGGFTKEPFKAFGMDFPEAPRMPFGAFSRDYTICYSPDLGNYFRPHTTRVFLYFSGQFLYFLPKYRGINPETNPEMWGYTYREWVAQATHVDEQELLRKLVQMDATDEETIYAGLADYTLPQATLYAKIALTKIRNKHSQEKSLNIPILLDLPPKHIWKPQFQELDEKELYSIINKHAIYELEEMAYLLEDPDLNLAITEGD